MMISKFELKIDENNDSYHYGVDVKLKFQSETIILLSCIRIMLFQKNKTLFLKFDFNS